MRVRPWPFVGRDGELDAVGALLREGRGVLLHGDAGVGKTRLARQIEQSWAQAGGSVVSVSGTTSTTEVPLSALSHLIPAVQTDAHMGERATELQAGVVRSFRELAASHGPVLLSVDDAPLLDEASLSVLAVVVRQHIAVLLGTVRRGARRRDVLTALWRDEVVERVALAPIAITDVHQLLRLALEGPVEQATVRRLWDATHGNLLFLREVVRTGTTCGHLAMHNGLWRWTGPVSAPESLVEVIQGRLDELPEPVRHGLEVVALVEPIEAGILGRLLPESTIELLEHEGLVDTQRHQEQLWLSCAHPLYGEVMRLAVTPRRAAVVRLAVAASLNAASPVTDESRLRSAVLMLEAGQIPGRRHCLDAAWVAWARGDADLTRRLADAALVHGPDPEAVYVVGEALAAEGRFEDAARTWASLEDVTEPEYIVARVAQSRVPLLALSLGRPDEATRVYTQAMTRLVDPELRGLLQATHDAVLPPDDLPPADAVLEVPDGVNDEAVAWAWISRAQVALDAARPDFVLAGSDTIQPIIRRACATWPLAALFADVHRFLALIDAGHLLEAEAMAGQQLDLAMHGAEILSRSLWTQAVGHVALARGYLARATEHLHDAIALLRSHDPGTLAFALVSLSVAESGLGDYVAAQSALDDANAMGTVPFVPPISPTRAAALIAYGQGCRHEAVESLQHALDAARRSHHLHTEIDLLTTIIQLGEVRPTDAARLEALAARTGLPHHATLASAARGLADGNAALLEAAADRAGATGADGDAADWWTLATAMRRQEGQRAAAARAQRAADHFLQRCGPRATPAQQSTAPAARLTARELEVARLAAQGLTNRQLSDRLGLSVRTVHSHLRAAFAKLGVQRRDGLAEMLGQVAEPRDPQRLG